MVISQAVRQALGQTGYPDQYETKDFEKHFAKKKNLIKARFNISQLRYFRRHRNIEDRKSVV